MAAKPRGRPPADGNWIVWTDAMVNELLRLRFEQFSVDLAAARGTKSLKQAWATLAAELSRQNGSEAVSVEQCRNKASSRKGLFPLLKALKSKWLAYHAGGLATAPACLELMDVYWADEREQAVLKMERHPRPASDTRHVAKRPRPAASTPALIAPAPTPLTTATSPASTTATVSPAQLLDVGMQAISQGFTDIASAAAEAARPKPVDGHGDLVRLEKLVDTRFAALLERQDAQLRQMEVQNQLLARMVAALERSRGAATSTVYFRQQSGGSIFALDGRDQSQTELEGSDRYARFVGMTLHRRLDRLFWSDGRVISSASATDGSDLNVIIGALARVVWIGTNFGQTQADVQLLTVSGVRCVSILSWSSSRVECLVGLPQRFSQQELPLVSETDCTIQTTQGSMTGFALNYHEMLAAGYPSPIVERLDIEAAFILPHALTIDDREDHEWLYWSNSADGSIYRSHLQSTAIDVLQERRWSVRGLALSIPSEPLSASGSLFFSLESKGTISQLELPSSSSRSPPEARIVLGGLRSPRGLAIDSSKQMLFFTEKTGRIYQAKLDSSLQARQQQQTLLDDASIVTSGIDVRRIITRPSIARLDGIAVDSKYVSPLRIPGLW
ncbi:hypothetical protein BBJ28_00010846 [Nothophytophthora sp. Chile5]|nr:hypothetical protein BBJ28_00010846 [Nothophytophthora sp. Chile5]